MEEEMKGTILEDEPKVKKEEKKWVKTAVLLAGLLIVCGLGYGTYWWLTKDKSKGEPAKAVTTTNTKSEEEKKLSDIKTEIDQTASDLDTSDLDNSSSEINKLNFVGI